MVEIAFQNMQNQLSIHIHKTGCFVVHQEYYSLSLSKRANCERKGAQYDLSLWLIIHENKGKDLLYYGHQSMLVADIPIAENHG